MAMKNLPAERREQWSPVRELSRLQRNIDRMFNDFYSGTPFWASPSYWKCRRPPSHRLAISRRRATNIA